MAAQQIWAREVADADEWLLRTLPRLEERGLLQFDASSETLDMHPAIRHTAIDGLSSEARSSTGVHVSDALSSRPRKPFEEARSLEDLALALTRVQALNAAGKFEAGWSLLIPELGDTLLRLEREDVILEILHSYFPESWDHPPREISNSKARSVDTLRWAARTLPGDSHARRKMEEQVLRFDLSLGYDKLVCKDLCAWTLFHTDSSPIACQFRLLVLAKRLAEALGDEECRHTCLLTLADYHLDRGDLIESRSCLEACRVAFQGKGISGHFLAWFAQLEIALARRSSGLTPALVEEAIKVVRSLGRVASEREILEHVAGWHRDRGAHKEALTAFNELIALANTTSARGVVPIYQARRAQSLIALNRTDEARSIVLKFEKDTKVPNLLSAVHYLALDDHQKAREHALGAYKHWWGDGPPFHHHWGLEDCRRVLAAVGEPEPMLQSCDPTKIVPFDFEADVERLIETTLAKKAEQKEAERKTEIDLGPRTDAS